MRSSDAKLTREVKPNIIVYAKDIMGLDTSTSSLVAFKAARMSERLMESQDEIIIAYGPLALTSILSILTSSITRSRPLLTIFPVFWSVHLHISA